MGSPEMWLPAPPPEASSISRPLRCYCWRSRVVAVARREERKEEGEATEREKEGEAAMLPAAEEPS
jgi:hypothetical protein